MQFEVAQSPDAPLRDQVVELSTASAWASRGGRDSCNHVFTIGAIFANQTRKTKTGVVLENYLIAEHILDALGLMSSKTISNFN